MITDVQLIQLYNIFRPTRIFMMKSTRILKANILDIEGKQEAHTF